VVGVDAIAFALLFLLLCFFFCFAFSFALLFLLLCFFFCFAFSFALLWLQGYLILIPEKYFNFSDHLM